MSLLEFALILSAVVAMYNIQQIKMTLKNKGYKVDAFKGWLNDYRQFKGLIQNERDEKAKIQYQKTLNGLLFSLGGVVLFLVMILRNRL